MKRILLTGIAAMFSATLFSQIFTDNFDSYTAGQDLVSQNPTDWDTWTGGAGTTEDVAISSANASSGANSLYFASTGGGPNDIILRFDQEYNSGNFTLESNFFVEAGKGAYFNMQETFVVGGVWAIDCFMLDDGTFNLKSGTTTNLSTTYPIAQWFNMRIEIDLTANVWELFIDNVSQGTFSNPVGSIAILNLYPTNPTNEGGNDVAGFYVDDVSFDHSVTSLPPVNGGVTYVAQIAGIVSQSVAVEGTVRNLGTDPITSFDIEYTYNGLPAVQESVGPVNMASLATYVHTFATPISLAAGSLPLTVSVSNVNAAGADASSADDANTITIDPIVPATGKMVLGEEATGTWCGWCPRGAVFMDQMENDYPDHWAGVAVHNGDPMTDAIYDAGIGAYISGYPNSLVDRGAEQDPSTMEPTFLNRIIVAPKAFLENGATYDPSTRILEVSVTTDFQSSTFADWRVGVILTEDGVTGTAGYDQTNYYAGNANGVMGGYEILPDPVPAAQMVYDHVARAIEPSFDGLANSFPSSIPSGLIQTNCFAFQLPVDWDETKMHIISFLRNPAGVIDNATKETINSAIANGYVDCATSVVHDSSKEEAFKLFPNPTNGLTFVEIINNDDTNVNVTVTDLTGKIVAQRDYEVNGAAKLPIVTSEFSKGIYVVTLTIGEVTQQQKLIVQ
ncbi:T9SS type A sorting domain-containing protein [Vicingaceae bacterium]|nr:T9SS type A sorting domain-containing protein [Vicingaceae bacterium]